MMCPYYKQGLYRPTRYRKFVMIYLFGYMPETEEERCSDGFQNGELSGL
jgi:hypothetical protein